MAQQSEAIDHPKIDFKRPDCCQVTQKFLRALSISKGDLEEEQRVVRLFAADVQATPGYHNKEQNVSWAATLLEHPDFTRMLSLGLIHLLQDRRSFTKKEGNLVFDYLGLLCAVSVDRRTVKFLLKTFPSFFMLLAEFMMDDTLSPAHDWLKFYAITVLATLTPWSKSLCTYIGESNDFLEYTSWLVIERPSNLDSKVSQNCLIILLNSLKFVKMTLNLGILFVRITAQVLAKSDAPGEFMCAAQILWVLIHFYPQSHELLLKSPSLLWSSLALASCEEAPETVRHPAVAALKLFHPNLRSIKAKEEMQQAVKQLLAANPQGLDRAQHLRSAVFAELPFSTRNARFTIMKVEDFIAGKSHLGGKGTECLLGPAIERKPRMKCSAAGCTAVEKESRQFRVCSVCRLAKYCSRGELMRIILLLSAVIQRMVSPWSQIPNGDGGDYIYSPATGLATLNTLLQIHASHEGVVRLIASGRLWCFYESVFTILSSGLNI